MKPTFLVLVILLCYSYVIYPAILMLISRVARKPWKTGKVNPPVSIVVVAYNEEKAIAEKIRNTLSLNYPSQLIEIIVSSDGSTDATNEIIYSFESSNLTVKAFETRMGKTACLNRVVPEVKGDIVLFTDANSMLPPDVLNKLVRHFADPEVGLVTGWTKYTDISGGEQAVGIYSRLERWTKIKEGQIASCVGADGAVFAVRKQLYRTLRDDDINDFVIPLMVVEQGKRVVMDPAIFCFEDTARGANGEYRRQVRISTRTLWAMRHNLRFLNPFKFGYFAFFVISHKLMRFLVPAFLIGTLVTNSLLAIFSHIFLIPLCVQVSALMFGVLGLLKLVNGRIARLAGFFLLTVVAQQVGWLRMLSGTTETTWTSQR